MSRPLRAPVPSPCVPVLLGALLAGCARPGIQSPRDLPTIPLDLDRLRREDAPSGLPLARVEVGGQIGWFVIDLGAGVTVLDPELASKAGLETKGTQAASGTGALDVTAGDLGDIPLDVLGLTQTEAWAISLEFPPLIKSRDVLGVLSPRQLVQDGQRLWIDLRQKRMSIDPSPGPWQAMPTEGVACGPEGQPPTHYTVDASIAGEAVTLLVDTGATRGGIADTPERRARWKEDLLETGEVLGAGGAVEVLRVGPLPFRTGAFEHEAIFELERWDAMHGCGDVGSFGMNVLRHCVIAIDSERIGADCRPR